jgi:tRNA1Val (adenine37-N6)-methyltransferase
VVAAPLTHDALLGGALRFVQPASGYRVNVDSILLAAFASNGRRAQLAVDLGAGVGVVAMLLHHHGAARELALVERDPALAELARQNLQGQAARGRVLVHDLSGGGLPRELLGAAELVVSNPPFFLASEHRAPKSAARQQARLGGLEPFIEAASRALSGPKSRAVFVYPARALGELLRAADAVKLVAKRLRFVHAYGDRPARLALVELRRARAGGLVVEPPLLEWSRPGRRSPELSKLTETANDRK